MKVRFKSSLLIQQSYFSVVFLFITCFPDFNGTYFIYIFDENTIRAKVIWQITYKFQVSYCLFCPAFALSSSLLLC